MDFTVWNTHDVPLADRFDYYRSSLCAAFSSLTPQPTDDVGGFSAGLKRWDCGEFALTRMNTQSHAVARTKRDIAKVCDENIYLNYVLRGSMKISQGDHRNWLRPGDFALIDNARPFEIQIESTLGHCLLVVQLPRHLFDNQVTDLKMLDSSPLKPLLRAQLQFLTAQTRGCGTSALPAVLTSLSALCSVSPKRDGLYQESRREAETLRLVKDLICQRYDDSDLYIDDVAKDIGKSKRTMQAHLTRLTTSFSDLLREHRLLMAYADLECRSSGESIEAIGLRNGFSDATSFYRNFRLKYGCAPGSVSVPRQRQWNNLA